MDAATNKVLAFVGRVEPRDWIDAMTRSDQLQHLGFLCWAACGKDPGYSPLFLLDEAARSARFSMPEFQKLAFDGAPPDPRELGTKWRAILLQARAIAEILPPEEIGKVVLKHDGELFRGEAVQLQDAVHNGALKFHAGAIGGVWPQIKS